MQENNPVITLQNKNSRLTLDQRGGAITHFCLHKHAALDPPDPLNPPDPLSSLNPLNFRSEQQPETGPPFFYQGHFLCLGRWGDPSEGEKRAGIPKHGDFNRVRWQGYPAENDPHDYGFHMKAISLREGLRIERTLTLDREQACFLVQETVSNIRPLGRMYNMVQHPTIGTPFLSADTRVDCNASEGFDYAHHRYEGNIFSHWPRALDIHGGIHDLRCPAEPYDSVFPFIVDPGREWGWITAYSPAHGLLLGYSWPRRDYPWINLWDHWSGDQLLHRGLEFGTTGIHKPFREILGQGLTHVLGQPTYGYLDAGEQVTKRYMGFLQTVGQHYKGVEDVRCGESALVLIEKETGDSLSMPHSLKYPGEYGDKPPDPEK